MRHDTQHAAKRETEWNVESIIFIFILIVAFDFFIQTAIGKPGSIGHKKVTV